MKGGESSGQSNSSGKTYFQNPVAVTPVDTVTDREYAPHARSVRLVRKTEPVHVSRDIDFVHALGPDVSIKKLVRQYRYYYYYYYTRVLAIATLTLRVRVYRGESREILRRYLSTIHASIYILQ